MLHRASLALLPALLLTGCALVDTHTPVNNVASSSVTGTVFGGQQPVVNANVSVYEVGSTAYGTGKTALATTTTDANGNFAFASNAYTCPFSNSPMYIVASGGNSGSGNNPNIVLIASLGPCSGAHSQSVNINEVTTAATVFALAQFFPTTFGSGFTPAIGGPTASPNTGVYTRGLVAAMNNTIPALVNTTTGVALSSSTSGTVTTTIETAKINSIANTLAACVNTAGGTASDTSTACGKLFSYTTPSGGTAPTDTLQAALSMALHPWQNVASLYNLAVPASPFVGLTAAPNDWTVAISYTNSALGVGISGTNPQTSMSMDIDSTGRPWFTSTKSGAVGVAYFDPASQSFNGPYNASTNAVAHPQYVAIDQSGVAWASDMSSGNLVGVSVTNPSTISTLQIANSTSAGPVIADFQNDLLTTYIGTISGASGLNLAAYKPDRSQASLQKIGADSLVATGLSDETFSGFFTDANGLEFTAYDGVAISSASSPCFLYNDNRNWTSVAQAGTNCSSGLAAPTVIAANGGYFAGAIMAATTANEICDDNTKTCGTAPVSLNAPEGIMMDGNNNIWVANSGNGSISTFGPTVNSYPQTATIPYIHNSTYGGTLTNPYALSIDASGNVWTVSPGCVDSSGTPCTPGAMVLTEMIGAAGPTTTPLSAGMAIVSSQENTSSATPESYKPQS